MKNIFRISSRWSQSKSILKDASYISELFRFTGIKNETTTLSQVLEKVFFDSQLDLKSFDQTMILLEKKKFAKNLGFSRRNFFS